MSRVQYFFNRLKKMDWKAMWKTTGLLKKRSGKGRLWLLTDMLRCGIKYNAGYIDYKIAQMYKLNDEQRKTVITRGISNDIVRRMNPREYWHTFDDKTEFNTFFKEWIPRKWIRIDDNTSTEELYALCRNFNALIGKPLEGSSGVGIQKYTAEAWKDEGICFNVSDPNIVDTGIIRMDNIVVDKLCDWFFRPLINTPEQGAANMLTAAINPEYKDVTGKIFKNCKPIGHKRRFYNNVKQRQLLRELTTQILRDNNIIL